MNSTFESSDSPDDIGGQTVGGFGYGIGLSVGVLILFSIITIASYIFTRWRVSSNPSMHRSISMDTTSSDSSSITIKQGLDETTLLTYPKLLYSEAKLHHGDSTASGCSICLADYKATDMLRLLPDCGHLFHLKCIDPWLRLHPTCPICRNSPIPTPLATPLAEVVPLAT